MGGTHVPLSIVDGVVQFVKVAGLGVVLGLGFGFIAFWILRRLNDHVLENAITIVLAWGSFIVAEQVGASGVISVVVAGLIIGNYGTKLAMGEQTVQTINTFWESIDFIINSIVFLLIGFELQDIGGLEALVKGRSATCCWRNLPRHHGSSWTYGVPNGTYHRKTLAKGMETCCVLVWT